MLDLVKIDATEEPEELLKLLTELDNDNTSRYKALHHEWELNVLMYLGRQWLQVNSGVDGYQILESDKKHYRPVTNHIARLCDLKRSQVLGKLIRSKVQPNSDTRLDITAARTAELLLKATDQIDSEDEVKQLAFLHAQIFGIAWRADFKKLCPYECLEEPVEETVQLKVHQCSGCGHMEEGEEEEEGSEAETKGGEEVEPMLPGMGDGETSSELGGMQPPGVKICPQCQEEMQTSIAEQIRPVIDQETGKPRVNRIPIYKNAVEMVDPFRVRTNACALKKDLRYIDEATIQPVEWVKASYNVQGAGFIGEEAVEKVIKDESLPRGLRISESFKRSVARANSSIAKDVSTSNNSGKNGYNEEDSTVLHKTYFAPMDKHKNGRLVVWTMATILYDGAPDIPKKNKLKRWHPYNNFMWRKHPLRFEGIPYIEDLIPLNKRYNSLMAMVMEHMDKTASPLRVDFSSVAKNNDDQTEGVLVIDAQPNIPGGGVPTYLQHPQMASEVYNMLESTVAEMEKVGNVTEIVQGLRPAGVDTYRGLQLLRDAAQSSESELFSNFYEFVRSCAQLKLTILQECILTQDEDLVEIMNTIRKNENYGLEEIKGFLGEDLRNNLNVVIEEGDYMSQSVSSQADQVGDLLKQMILTPEDLQDPVVKLQLLRKLGMERMPMSDKADIEKTERIIEYLESKEFQKVMQVLSYRDNRSLQLRVLSEWTKTSKYDSLAPDIKQAGEMLMKHLETQILQAQNAAQQATSQKAAQLIEPQQNQPAQAVQG